jgi:hypothetical protein
MLMDGNLSPPSHSRPECGGSPQWSFPSGNFITDLDRPGLRRANGWSPLTREIVSFLGLLVPFSTELCAAEISLMLSAFSRIFARIRGPRIATFLYVRLVTASVAPPAIPSSLIIVLVPIKSITGACLDCRQICSAHFEIVPRPGRAIKTRPLCSKWSRSAHCVRQAPFVRADWLPLHQVLLPGFSAECCHPPASLWGLPSMVRRALPCRGVFGAPTLVWSMSWQQ